ncbi:MAG: thioredoxin family protein [Planctomycetota bacterium]|jgi:hypothetical protein
MAARALVVLAALAIAASPAAAQGYAEKRDRKLKEEWLRKAKWITDFDRARKKAKETKKMIFAYFTRSYAYHAVCSGLEKKLFSGEEFVDWSGKYVLFCHVTTQVKSDAHQGLLRKKGGTDFPYIAFLDGEGNVLARHGEEHGVEAFAETAEEAEDVLKKLADLAEKAAEDDEAAKKELFLLKLELSHFSPAEARRGMREVKLTDAERAELEAKITNLEVNEILAGVKRSRETRIPAGKQFARMWRKGHEPAEDKILIQFLYCIMIYAESEEDTALFEKALRAFRKKFGEEEKYDALIKKQQRILEDMRERQ